MSDQESEEQSQLSMQEAPDGLLYHYTDEKGLYGILDSGEIWATHYRFLNDLAERKGRFRAPIFISRRYKLRTHKTIPG